MEDLNQSSLTHAKEDEQCVQVFCGELRSTKITKSTLLGKSQLEHSNFREKEINKREKTGQGICQEGAVAFPLFCRCEEPRGSSLGIHTS